MKIISENLSTIKNIFQKNRVVLAYLFGSAAKGKTTKLSDLKTKAFSIPQLYLKIDTKEVYKKK